MNKEFTWTDSLVTEYAVNTHFSNQKSLEQFKQSKIKEKERIELRFFKPTSSGNLAFWQYKCTEEQFREIKKYAEQILNDEQPKSEQDKLKTGTLTMDEYFANCVKRQEKYNQHQSGEFITKEECEQRERKAFDAAREREGIPMNPNGAPPFLKYDAFSNYKQSLKQ